MKYFLYATIFFLVSTVSYAKDAHYCISEAIYFEARGESQVGMVAVGQVILNRVRSPIYPNDPCKVVYQRHQFSYFWDGKPEIIRDKRAWMTSTFIAQLVLSGQIEDITDKATHYHASYVTPDWLIWVEPSCNIGAHRFYRLKEGVK
jgi:spore germination cell wall hydrolase CwlJ-like protein